MFISPSWRDTPRRSQRGARGFWDRLDRPQALGVRIPGPQEGFGAGEIRQEGPRRAVAWSSRVWVVRHSKRLEQSREILLALKALGNGHHGFLQPVLILGGGVLGPAIQGKENQG